VPHPLNSGGWRILIGAFGLKLPLGAALFDSAERKSAVLDSGFFDLVLHRAKRDERQLPSTANAGESE
jgi:hypothetical protein